MTICVCVRPVHTWHWHSGRQRGDQLWLSEALRDLFAPYRPVWPLRALRHCYQPYHLRRPVMAALISYLLLCLCDLCKFWWISGSILTLLVLFKLRGNGCSDLKRHRLCWKCPPLADKELTSVTTSLDKPRNVRELHGLLQVMATLLLIHCCTPCVV